MTARSLHSRFLSTLLALLALCFLCGAAQAQPKAGETLPDLRIRFSGPDKDAAYLGVGSGTFGLGEIKADLVLLEIVGAYCPICHQQAPDMGRLHQRARKNPRLADKVKFLALAVGATDKETELLRVQFKHDFPILNDPDYQNHKLLGEPKTPFTMLVRSKTREILWTHLGRIEDFDGLNKRMEEALK